MTPLYEALTSKPATVEEAFRAPGDGGVPEADGLYVWWVRDDALPRVPAPPHSARNDLRVLYVGVAPKSAASSATLRTRVLENHLGSSLASSTFKRKLAAQLWELEGWTPRLTDAGRWKFDAADSLAMKAWQRAHLCVSWCPLDEPWRHEALAIETLQAPLNTDDNPSNPFLDTLEAARLRFVAAATHGAPTG